MSGLSIEKIKEDFEVVAMITFTISEVMKGKRKRKSEAINTYQELNKSTYEEEMISGEEGIT